MDYQLESRRFQQDVIVRTFRFREAKHDQVKGRDPIRVPREEHCAGA
jgi:hypothetical protein